jgi:transcriptional regulator with XRE-family HTH domain
MIIGDRVRSIREFKNLSQGDIEERTGLLRFYISRVENGHVVPSLETLERLARGLEVPLYALLYTGKEPPSGVAVRRNGHREVEWGTFGKDGRYLNKLRACLGQMSEEDRETLLSFTRDLVTRKNGRSYKSDIVPGK